MRRIIILLLFSFWSVAIVFAQQSFESFRSEINKDTEKLASHNFEDECLGAEILAIEIGEKITNYINASNIKSLNTEDFPYISVDTLEVNDGDFACYSFAYHSGGTAGTITNCVLVKEKDGRSVAYNFANKEFAFTEMYELVPETYLALGWVPGSSTCWAKAMSIINFSGDTAVYHPIFENNDEFRICNSRSHYDKETKILTFFVEDLPAYAEDTCEEEFATEKYKCFLAICNDEDDEGIHMATLQIKYDGEKFVKPE